MATIRNTIRTDFVESGADRVTDATENVGRAQTRMGQASAGAGRSFAAQSQGLGGLVGAYAGAAATVFALQAAFDALAKAAQAENIVKGTSALASELGQSGPRILKSIKDITQGQLTLEEASNAANLALSSGFNSKQIESLSKVALGASRALGRNLTDAMTRVVRGAAKMEPELLDELGIFTRIEPAVDAYARKMNITASSMTEFERRQAFLNAVIEEGTRKFANIDTTSGSAQKSLEQLSVMVIELGTSFGQLINEYLLPVVNFFKNDFGNTMLLFLGVLTLVFGKAGALIGGFATGGIEKMSGFASSMANIAGNMGGLDLSGVASSASRARDEAYTFGINSRRQGSFNPRIAGESAENTAELTRAVAAQSDGTLRNVSSLRANNQVLERNRDLLAENSPRRTYLTSLIDSNTAALSSSNRASRTLLGTSTLLTGAVRGLAVGFNVLGKAMNFAFAGIAILQLAGTLFDKDYLGDLLDFFNKITAATKRNEEGFLGLVTAASAGGQSIAEQFKDIGSEEKALDNVAARLLAIRDIVEAPSVDQTFDRFALTDESFKNFDKVANNYIKTYKTLGDMALKTNMPTGYTPTLNIDQDALGDTARRVTVEDETGKRVGGQEALNKAIAKANRLIRMTNSLHFEDGQFQHTAILDAHKKVAALETGVMLNEQLAVIERIRVQIRGGGLEDSAARMATNAEQQLNVQQMIVKTIRSINDLHRQDPSDEKIQPLREQLILERQYQDMLEKRMETFPMLAAGLSKVSGRSIDQVGTSIRKVFDQSDESITIFGEKLLAVGGKIDFNTQTKQVKELAEAFVLADGTLDDLTQAFNRGNTNVNALSGGINGIRMQLDKMIEEGKSPTADFLNLQKRFEELKEINQELKKTQQLGKDIREAFSKEMKRADSSISSGEIGLDGGIAASEEEKVANQRALLILGKSLGDEAQKQVRQQQAILQTLAAEGLITEKEYQKLQDVNQELKDRIANGQSAVKAARGLALELFYANEQLLITEDKRVMKLEEENSQLKLSNKLANDTLRTKIKNVEAQTILNNLQADIALDKKLLDNAKARNKATLELVKKEQQLERQQDKRLVTVRKIAQETIAIAKASELAGQAVAVDAGESAADKVSNMLPQQQKDLQMTVLAAQEKLFSANIAEQQRLLDETKANQQVDNFLTSKALDEDRSNKLLEITENRKNNKEDIALFDRETTSENRKRDFAKIQLASQQKLEQAKLAAQIQAAEFDKSMMQFDRDKLDKEQKLRDQDILFVNKFVQAINTMGEIAKNTSGNTFNGSAVSALSTEMIATMDAITAMQDQNFATAQDNATLQIEALQNQAAGSAELNDAKMSQLGEQDARAREMREAERAALIESGQASISNLQADLALIDDKIAGVREESAAQQEKYQAESQAIQDIIKNQTIAHLAAVQNIDTEFRKAKQAKKEREDADKAKLQSLKDEMTVLSEQAVLQALNFTLITQTSNAFEKQKMAREETLKNNIENNRILTEQAAVANSLASQALEERKLKQDILKIQEQTLASSIQESQIKSKADSDSAATADEIRIQKLITDNRIAGSAAAALENILKVKTLNTEREVIAAKVREAERVAQVGILAAQEANTLAQEASDLKIKQLNDDKARIDREMVLETEKAVNQRIANTNANTLIDDRIRLLAVEKGFASTAIALQNKNRQNEYKLLEAKNSFLIKEAEQTKRNAIETKGALQAALGADTDVSAFDSIINSDLTSELEAQNAQLALQRIQIAANGAAEQRNSDTNFDNQVKVLGLEKEINNLRSSSISDQMNRTIAAQMNAQARIEAQISSEQRLNTIRLDNESATSGAAAQAHETKLAGLNAELQALKDQSNVYNTELINSIKTENFAIQDTVKGLEAKRVQLQAQVDLQKANLDISIKQAELALQAGAREQGIKAQEHILELAKMQNAEIEKAEAHTQRRLEQQNQLFELEQKIANTRRETVLITEETARNSANVDKQIELQNFIQENQLKGTAAAIAQYALTRETNLQEQTLLDAKIEESKRLATQEQDNIRSADGLRIRKQQADIAALETSKTIIRQEAALEIQKLVNQLRALEDAKTLNNQRKKILELEAKVAKDGITAAAEKTKLDLEVLKETNNTVIAQVEGAKQRARIEAAVLKANNPMADISVINAQVNSATEIVKQITTQNGLLDTQIGKVGEIAALEIKKIDDNLKTQLKLIDLDNKRISQEQDSIATSIEQTQELKNLKIASIDAEISRIKEAGELEGQLTLTNIRLSQAEADTKIAALEQQKQVLIDQARLSGVELVNAVRDEIVAQKDKTRELDKQIELLKAQAKVNALVRASKLKAVQTENAQNTVTRDLTAQKASLTLARQKADINTKDRATALDTFKMNQKIAQQQSDLAMAGASASAAGAQSGIQANATKETAALQNKLDRSILNQRDTVMLQVKLAEVSLKAALASAGVKANLAKKERDAAIEALDRREALLMEELKAQGAALQEERDLFIEQMKIVEQEEALVREKMKQDILQMSRDKQNLTALEKLALKKNDADTKQRQFELELLKKQYVLLRDQRASKLSLLAEEARIAGVDMPVQTETDRRLDQGIKDMIRQLDTNIGKEGQVGSLKGDDITADFASQRAIIGERQKDLLSEFNSVLDLQRIKQDGRNLELAEFDKLAVKQVESYLKNLESLGLERDMVEQNFVAKMQSAGMEAQAAKDLFKITKERLEFQLTAEAKLKDMVEALIVNINDGLGNAINKVFDNIAEGKSIKDGLGDIFADTFENIRKTVLQKTLIEPAKDAFRGLVGNLIPGLGLNEEKGADNAKVIDGALLTTSGSAGGAAASPAEKMKEDVEKKGMGFFDGFKEKAMNVFGSMKEGIGNFGSSAMETFKGLGGSLGNIFSSVTSGLGSLFGGGGAGGGGGIMSSIMGMFGGGGGAAGGGGTGIMSSIMGMFGGAATGGMVGMTGVRNMAAGGQVNALRDRVPAMLEPGEFVMRKPAVKSIGAGNLGQMNATGAANMGNVQFNIVNEGNPKEAQQQGEPKLDADKIVIDVVMRDLASNGPIRQAMRNG